MIGLYRSRRLLQGARSFVIATVTIPLTAREEKITSQVQQVATMLTCDFAGN